MNKNLGQEIHWSNLKKGVVYRVHDPQLGQVLARLTNVKKLTLLITEGKLHSKAQGRSWNKGDEFEAIPDVCTFYEVR